MARVTVDIDLDDIDLDELLDEIEDRYEDKSWRKSIHKDKIFKWAEELFKPEDIVPELCLTDQMKIDFLMANIEKISLTDLENLIK